jgi:hypothetical protein
MIAGGRLWALTAQLIAVAILIGGACAKSNGDGAGGNRAVDASAGGNSACRRAGKPCETVDDCCESNTCRKGRCCAETGSDCLKTPDCCDSTSACTNGICTRRASAGAGGAAGSGAKGGAGGASGASQCKVLAASCQQSDECCTPYSCHQDLCCSMTGASCDVNADCCMLQDTCEVDRCISTCSQVDGPCDVSIDCCVPLVCDQDQHICSASAGSGGTAGSGGACQSIHESCSTTSPCCSPLRCHVDKCCSATFGRCSASTDCCYPQDACRSGKCMAPSGSGGQGGSGGSQCVLMLGYCTDSSQCCSPMHCVDNVCCAATAGPCQINDDCCSATDSCIEHACSH